MITALLLTLVASALLALAMDTGDPAAWAGFAVVAALALLRAWLWAHYGGQGRR